MQVLNDFPSCRIPLEALLEAAPRLQPRQFSISSSPLAHPSRVHVTVAVVDFQTPFKRRVRGLCSSWLASLPLGYAAAHPLRIHFASCSSGHPAMAEALATANAQALTVRRLPAAAATSSPVSSSAGSHSC